MWSLDELVVVISEYVQNYKSSKYKINEEGKMKNNKYQGTVSQFYNTISAALLQACPIFSTAVKGKDLNAWYKRYFKAIDGSGHSSVENLHTHL